MAELSCRIALVTGAGRGVGRCVALKFAAAGASVAAIARTRSDLESTASEATGEGTILPVVADVSRANDVARAVTVVRDGLGPVDILVNNAGVFLHKPIVETTPDEWRRVFDVNVLGPLLLTREILPQMLQRGSGRIINICSTASHRGYLGQSAYVASKHALLGFTKVLASETHGTGVRVHAISPGGVNTSMVRDRDDVDFSAYMDPDEIAEIALFLAKLERLATIDEVVIRRIGAEPFR